MLPIKLYKKQHQNPKNNDETLMAHLSGDFIQIRHKTAE
jgi:hypothetical protein